MSNDHKENHEVISASDSKFQRKKGEIELKVAGRHSGAHLEITVHKYLVFYLIPQVSHCFLNRNYIIACF